MQRKTFLRALSVGLIAVSSLGFSAISYAQSYPNKPVSLMVPYPAGGLSDIIARVVNQPLGKHLGQQAIVENLGGASGAIAAQKVLSAPADGYNVFQGSPNELILAPLAISSIKFKSEDFRLVQMIGTAHMAFLARGNLDVKSIDELLDYARKQAKDGKPITYASVGPGSFYHILGEHLAKTTGIPMTHVPYKGGAPALQDLGGGMVDIFLTPYGKHYEEMAKTGKIKILGMLNSERMDGLKHHAAVSESKQIPKFVFNIWTGYFVEKDTPEPIVQTLHKALTATLSDPAVRTTLDAHSMQVAKPASLEDNAKAYADGIAQFRAIVKSMDLKAQ